MHLNSSREAMLIVATTGIHNFRDYGGYAVAGGGRLVEGRLYRSGEHTKATQNDLDILRALGRNAVIDLRGKSERAKAPCRRHEGFSGVVIASDGETAAFAPHVEAASQAMQGADARKTLTSRYKELPFRPALVDVFRQYFHTLAESDGPTVVYCSAGKDRTGVLVALLHTLMGVHRDDVVNDYLLTNTAGDSAARTAAIRADLEKRFGAGLTDEAVRVITSVEAGFLEAAFDAITAAHGSVDAYASTVLHVTRDMRGVLESRLIV